MFTWTSTGDVLTGLIAGLLAQGTPPLDAACADLDDGGRVEPLVTEVLGLDIHTIGDQGVLPSVDVPSVLRPVEMRMAIHMCPEITMPRCLSDACAAGVDTGSWKFPGVQRPFDTEAIASAIAYGRKAGHEVVVRPTRRMNPLLESILIQQSREIRRYHDVPMSLDHARHQHPAAAVDHGHIVGLNDGQRVVRHGFDAIALDQDMPVSQQRFGLAVEDVDVADERQPRSRFLRGPGETRNANGKHHENDGQNVVSHAENCSFHG